MRKLLMVRFGEIYLKGQNRPFFLNLLMRRIRTAVRPLGGKVTLNDGRFYVTDYSDEEAAVKAIQKIFGVHSLCVAVEMGKESFEDIKKTASELMEGCIGTFKVESRRSDKRFALTSPDINREVGAYILNCYPHLSVDVHKPDHLLSVEIRDRAFIYNNVIPGPGGMPVGSNGKATLLLSGGIDSPVAGYLVAKRGVELSAVHFYSYPYTGERSKDKVVQLAKKLSAYCCGMKLYIVPFTEIQMQIHQKSFSDHTTLIMRRFMMRIADKVAQMDGAQALVTGEAIGQVASQTMEAIVCTDAVATMPVFRPLIGFDKVDIIRIAEEIDTYETSCLPYEDCCTVFTPKHPVTRPKMEKVLKAEEPLDVDALMQQAIEGIEVIEL
jgi:thiamine biosynthesis protein ThiI